jgi:7,8-dihydropterin-6-yl-methyl-4-(beta-D-ribofuranosyl)aminobenzene 5'-phosphate synthase
MKARVISVYDEGAIERTSLIGAQGLSILVDVDDELTLFDTGMRGRYLMHNLEYLEINANDIKRVVLSHAHRTHTGGLPVLLENRNEKIDVLMPPGINDVVETKMGILKQSGMPKIPDEASAKMNRITINEWTQLSDRLFVTGCIPGDGIEEIALVMMSRNGPVVICGCCHHGIVNTIAYVKERTGKKVSAVVGGTHLIGLKKKEVHAIAETLKDNGPPMMHLNHCTGVSQKTHLREKLGLNAVKEFYAGTEIKFEV